MKAYVVNYKIRGIYGEFSNYVEAESLEQASNAVKLNKKGFIDLAPEILKVEEIKEIPEGNPYYDSFGFLRGARKTTETTNSNLVMFGC